MSYLVDPIIVQGQPNMLFGDGGLGKSLAAIWMASMVTEGWQAPWPTMPGRVLYLDWEADHAEHHRRLKRIANGLGFDSPSAIGHRRCVGALAGDTEILSRAVKKYAIDMVIVDSANPACGGLPNDLDAVQNFFTALRHMEVTSLIIAHVPKGPDGQPRNDPFGSVHWKNLCRNVWQIAKDSDMDASSMKLALWHRKSNEGTIAPSDSSRPTVRRDGHRLPAGTDRGLGRVRQELTAGRAVERSAERWRPGNTRDS